MAATINIQQNEAKAWQKQAEDLNTRTDELLKMVGNLLESLKAESVGDFVDELVNTGTKLLANGAEMITAMNGLIDAISQILGALVSAVAEAVGNVLGNFAKNVTV